MWHNGFTNIMIIIIIIIIKMLYSRSYIHITIEQILRDTYEKEHAPKQAFGSTWWRPSIAIRHDLEYKFGTISIHISKNWSFK